MNGLISLYFKKRQRKEMQALNFILVRIANWADA